MDTKIPFNRAAPISRMTFAFVVFASIWVTARAVDQAQLAGDAAQYYLFRMPDPYLVSGYVMQNGGFYYSPVAAMAVYPITLGGLYFTSAVMTAIEFAALFALVGRWSLVAILFPPVWWDISLGNINLLLGAAVVWGVRYPALWAVPLLTKVTPGVGILWFAVRREWRSLGIAIGATAALVGLSLLLAGTHLWADWFTSLTASVGTASMTGVRTVPIPLIVRLTVAAILVVVAARTSRVWLLLVACTIAVPVLWIASLAPLVAVPKLLMDDMRARRRPGRGTPERSVVATEREAHAAGAASFG
jgi:hypothetical protein